MIIEDGDGHIVTTDELHHCEPGGPAQEPAYSLDQIERALAAYRHGRDPHTVLDPVERADAEQAADFLLDAMPQLLADLAAAHERLARWEEAPTREDWTVTADAETPPTYGQRYTINAALVIAARDGMQAWRRVVADGPIIVSDWEPVDLKEPPF